MPPPKIDDGCPPNTDEEEDGDPNEDAPKALGARADGAPPPNIELVEAAEVGDAATKNKFSLVFNAV